VNFVFRGTGLPPERRSPTPAAQQMVSANVEIPILAAPELYGGKLVAALDRQHPRDLFDVRSPGSSSTNWLRGWNGRLRRLPRAV